MTGCAFLALVLGTKGESMGSDGGVLRDDEGGDEVNGGARPALADAGAGVGGLAGAGPFLGTPKKDASVVCLVLLIVNEGDLDKRVENSRVAKVTPTGSHHSERRVVAELTRLTAWRFPWT